MSTTSEKVRDPTVGEAMDVYGEKFVWTSEHMLRKELDPLMFTYDELAANAYECALQLFNEEQEKLKAEEGGEANKKPKRPVKPDIFQIVKDNAATQPALGKLWEHVNTVPDWVDWNQLGRAQKVFYRYGVANLMSLGYQSLFVGMAAWRIVEVLLRTGGFSPAAAKKRSFETAQWVLEIMRDVDSIRPGGAGWESTVRVRLLHSAVRYRISEMAKAKPEYFNTEEWGVPINDLDSAATICSFSTAPILSGLPRQKIKMRKQEIADYIALWRYIAYLIGAPERFFATPDSAKKLQESMIYYELDPNENSRVLADNLLKSFIGQPPFYAPAGLINAAARCLAGEKLSNELGVAKVNLIWRGLWSGNTTMYKGYAYMCRSIPWFDKGNIKMMRKLTWKIVVEGKHGLGGERSKFPMKYQPSYDRTKAD
ncbi:uncharacterized protein PV09_00991 [Verruconis gallopava]|uniref:ER-bound oxygenase mpaB/mpaB'/Rubber oxygenase catalytic domain-containing protein n=1 Tax=Verruconis gallopava TaxID=253628 RepID=A0A0D1XZ43_9PEZI|nr:uncharacterized protein PV09_00991 [Verruconis gallopava]KIW08046.1 hypothetical protein PV09_00991 [Verruconis gallopava]